MRIGHRLGEVGFTKRNHVFVWHKQVTAVQGLHPVGGLTPERRFHFFGNDGTTEHPRRQIVDGDFKLALDALHEAHVTSLPFLTIPCRVPLSVMWPVARVLPPLRQSAWYRSR